VRAERNIGVLSTLGEKKGEGGQAGSRKALGPGDRIQLIPGRNTTSVSIVRQQFERSSYRTQLSRFFLAPRIDLRYENKESSRFRRREGDSRTGDTF
jgi:hypothetical protein